MKLLWTKSYCPANWQVSIDRGTRSSSKKPLRGAFPSSQEGVHSKRLFWIESYCPVNWQVSIDRGARSNSKNPLEVHSLPWHSYYTKEFDVRTYITDSAEYMLCSLNLLTFQRGMQITTFIIRHFNTNIFSKLTRIKINFQQNKDNTYDDTYT